MNLPLFKKRQPQAGVSLQEDHLITLNIPVERPCVAMCQPGVDILISRPLLEAMSARADEISLSEKDPELRLARFRGMRAKAILVLATSAGADGKFQVAMNLLKDSSHLLGELLENGFAEIVCHNSYAYVGLVSQINVSYYGNRAGPTLGFGFITFNVANSGPPLLHLNWWSS